jgi:hypothetical protein
VDIAVSSKFAIRWADADHELTRFGNNFTGRNNSQSNFRFQITDRSRAGREWIATSGEQSGFEDDLLWSRN